MRLKLKYQDLAPVLERQREEALDEEAREVIVQGEEAKRD
jgi:hypothetical protein